MAQAINYFPSQNVSVWYQKETSVGLQPDDAALTKLQTISFTIPEGSVPLELSSQKSGQFTQTISQAHHSEGTKMWTFDTVLRGTPAAVKLACEAVFEDGASECELSNAYAFPKASYQNASTASPGTFDIRFEDAGAMDSANNVVCNGCIGTGFTLTEDIGSEGGELVCTINWATGFRPVLGADAITSGAYDTETPKNIRELLATSSEIESGNDMVIQSWELSCNRTIERIHYKDIVSGTFAPFGYAMTGGFEVTGSMTVIRNEDVGELYAIFYNSTAVDINLANTTSAEFTIALDKCMINEPSIDSGGAVLLETIPFTVLGVDDTSGAGTKMLGITITT